ncbi:MAG: hypothetical protein GX076_05225 [Clostridiales bacterium]|nr:hypothetical protein [Clostridiales bacterium]
MKDWVWNIFLMIAALSFIELVLPEGGIHKYLKFIFSLMILGVIVYPIGNASFNDITASIYVSEQGEVKGDMGDSLLERIISVQTKQIEEVYKEKLDALKEEEESYKLKGISIPWPDIYSIDEEESD